jgi:drug/metabolite transporter (DMT)-like permease
MAEVLALTSALCFGVTHFVSGLVSRRHPGVLVAAYAQLGGTAVSFVLLSVPNGTLTGSALVWGALSGFGTGIGVAFLYRAMHAGAMSIVVPLSDLGALFLPVLFGVLLLQERPSALAVGGIVASFPAIWLVSRGTRSGADRRDAAQLSAGVPDALIAGVGFAVQFIAMGQVPAGTGWWPVIASRVVSLVLILLLVYRESAFARLPGRHLVMALGAGAVGTVAIVLYLLATQQQLMAIAVVLSALYPAIPVLLALFLLHERVNRVQAVGLVCAAAAIALLSLK